MGGGAYSYIRVHRPYKQSISKEINNAKHEYMNMPLPPPLQIIDLATPLNKPRIDEQVFLGKFTCSCVQQHLAFFSLIRRLKLAMPGFKSCSYVGRQRTSLSSVVSQTVLAFFIFFGALLNWNKILVKLFTSINSVSS